MTDPKPPIPANVDLRDFPFMPLDVMRLRDSDLASVATDAEFRAAVMLWCAAWHQVPAGSLPDDVRTLTHLAGLGRDVEAFENVRRISLGHFRTHSDGRLYHKVIVDKALEAWDRKCAAKNEREANRQRKREARGRKNQLNQEPCPGGHPVDIHGTSDGQSPDIPRKSAGSPPEVRSMTGTGTSKKKKPPISPAMEMKDIWNEICGKAGLAEVKKMPSGRSSSLNKRLYEDFHSSLDEWRAYCQRIADSPFLTGNNDRGWKAEIDWVLKPANLAKIVEGKYDDATAQANGSGEPYMGEYEYDLREDYKLLRTWGATGHWEPWWGPKPGEKGCNKINADVLALYGPGGSKELRTED